MTTLDRDTSDYNDEKLARLRGSEDAKAFDLRLRQNESEEREKRLLTLNWKPQTDRATHETTEDSIRVVQLEARVSELNTYVRSVRESLPWRIIQRMRRLFGRSW